MTALSTARSADRLPVAGALVASEAIAPRQWLRWLAPLLSLTLFAVALWQVRALDMRQLWATAPAASGFWLALGASYIVPPLSEWVIYRRLWRLPIGGLAPLFRKYVSNEVLLGYSGEVYFYGWARERLSFAGSPFGAVRDVSVLSAQAGNLATLAMLLAAWPWLGLLHLDGAERHMFLSCIVAMAVSLPIFLFRHTLFALPSAELRRIMTIHLVRIGAVLLLSALAWHIAMPAMGFGIWLLLAAIRQLLSRLPFMPNKDFMFAALVVFLMGAHSGAADVITLSATLILALHLIVGVALTGGELLLRPARV